jgi:hypothetical protein
MMKNAVAATMMKRYAPCVYGLVALFILWPLLAPGFILTLDMVFTPKLPMPGTVTSSYLFHAGLHFLNVVLSGDVIEKILLFVILLFSGLGMHRLMDFLRPTLEPATTQWAAYASGLLYMINPFTYERFMAGQYSVLLGYAYLPFFVLALFRFLKDQSLRRAAVLVGWLIAISIVSIHTLGLAFIVSLIAISQVVWNDRADVKRLRRLVMYTAGIGSIFFIVSSYWLLPLLRGEGPTAASIDTFQTTDQTAFATGGGSITGKLVHVIRLEGFWGEERGLFLLPQDELRVWGLAVIALWALVVIGILSVWRQKRETGVLFVIVIIAAALLAAGIGSDWLSAHIPFFAGYREPQKFVALVAFSYAVLVGFAIPKLLQMFPARFGPIWIAVTCLCALVGLTPVMFFGFDGQLVPRHYPPDWYAMNAQIDRDTSSYQVLFLPWHLYTRYQFAGRVIANPGSSFFDMPLLISNNPELGDTGPAVPDEKDSLLTTRILPQAPHSNTLGRQLAPLQIKYVLLSKNDDYRTYGYLDHQTDLQLVTDSATLRLYRNTAYTELGK